MPMQPCSGPPHLQHALTSLLVNRHGSAHTSVFEVGGLWQDSQDPKGSPHPSTSSILSLGWTPKSARSQEGLSRTLPSLLGKCQLGKFGGKKCVDLASSANSGPEPLSVKRGHKQSLRGHRTGGQVYELVYMKCPGHGRCSANAGWIGLGGSAFPPGVWRRTDIIR